MLYISARKRICRFSLFSGKALENVTSQLNRRVPGIGIRLPAPAFPKHDIDCPTPCCGVGPGVQLHGFGITKTLSFKIWLPGVPLALAPGACTNGVLPAKLTCPDGSCGLPTTSILAASAPPVQFIWGLAVVVPEKEIPGTPTRMSLRIWVMPETVQ